VILKRRDARPAGDRLFEAGQHAEDQMAHYLARAFADADDVYVFNDLRLVKTSDGDAAQFDHLLIHRAGAVIIESKSVTGRVRVNGRGEWTRSWQQGGGVSGMPSPVLQAERQKAFLHARLIECAEQLLGKRLGVFWRRFDTWAVDTLVAISDQGIIDSAPDVSLPNVCKADQAPDKARAVLERQRREASALPVPLTRGGLLLSPDDLDRVSRFLILQHTPVYHPAPAKTTGNAAARPASAPLVLPGTPRPTPSAATPRKSPAPVPKTTSVVCAKCQSDRVRILLGKYGYYLRCVACNENSALNAVCLRCGAKERIRKDGNQFFAECDSGSAACHGKSRLFHVNPAAPPRTATPRHRAAA